VASLYQRREADDEREQPDQLPERQPQHAGLDERPRQHDIYRWAGMLVGELARLPQETAVSPAS
jgi:hypothetical protein